MKVLVMAVLAALLASPVLGGQDGKPAGPAPDATPTAAPGIWIDVYQGEPLRYEKLLEDLATAAVVYLGEFHTVQRHHAIQTQVLTDLARRGVSLCPWDSTNYCRRTPSFL